MKVNSASDSNKNTFLIFNNDQNSNFPKKNFTKTRNELKHDFFNFNSHDKQEFQINNNLRSKPKEINYLSLKNDIFQNDESQFSSNQNNFKNFFQNENNDIFPKINDSSSRKERPNINIIICAPNIILGKKDNSQKDNNLFFNSYEKDKKKEIDDFNTNKNEYEKDNNANSLKKDKNFLDCQLNLLEEICGKNDVTDLIKKLTDFKLNSYCDAHESDLPTKRNIDSSKDKNSIMYTNTGDSMKFYTNDDEDGKNNNFNYDMSNPYLNDYYKWNKSN